MKRYAGPQVVFHVHLMKTAGSTVNDSLMDFYRPVSRYVQAETMMEAAHMKASPQLLFNLPAKRRDQLRYISAHMPLSAAFRYRDESARPVSITLLLRDGFERAVSHLVHLARQLDFAFSYRELMDDPVLGEYFLSNHQTRALATCESAWSEWQRCFDRILFLKLHLETPTANFTVSAVTESDLARAISDLPKLDVLGLQSEFENWWRRCHARVGWPLAHSAPTNVGSRKHKRAAPQIPGSVLDELRERNRLDARLYAAAGELLSAR